MAIVFVGIDLAKNVFAVHGVNTAGKAEMVRPNVPRAKLHELFAALPACVTDRRNHLRGQIICGATHLRGHICGVRSCNHTTSLGAGWGQGQSNVRDCKT